MFSPSVNLEMELAQTKAMLEVAERTIANELRCWLMSKIDDVIDGKYLGDIKMNGACINPRRR